MSFFNSSRLTATLAQKNKRNAAQDEEIVTQLNAAANDQGSFIGYDSDGEPIYTAWVSTLPEDNN